MSSSDNSLATMRKAPLVVIVTRLGTASEWTQWNFEEEARIAFVRESSPRVSTPQDLSDINVEQRVDGDDVWVMNGKYFWRNDTFELLGRIEWQKIERGIIKYIHVGQNKSLTGSRQQRLKTKYLSRLSAEKEKRNASAFLESPVPFVYSLMGKPIERRAGVSAVVDFALAIRGEPDEYNKALRNLRMAGSAGQSGRTEVPKTSDTQQIATQAEPGEPPSPEPETDEPPELVAAETGPRTPGTRLSALKHRLSHLFLPLSVDLQGWEESGFSEKYAKEIAEAYSKEYVDDILQKARGILYDTDESPPMGVIERIVAGARAALNLEKEADAKAQEEIETKWHDLRQKLPNRILDDSEPPRRTLELVAQLDEKTERDELRRDLLDEDSFQKWFAGLEEGLDELRKLLPS